MLNHALLVCARTVLAPTRDAYCDSFMTSWVYFISYFSVLLLGESIWLRPNFGALEAVSIDITSLQRAVAMAHVHHGPCTCFFFSPLMYSKAGQPVRHCCSQHIESSRTALSTSRLVNVCRTHARSLPTVASLDSDEPCVLNILSCSQAHAGACPLVSRTMQASHSECQPRAQRSDKFSFCC